jgi:NAD(P)-dependent dehydrogenase (short-subunit alcohol dehydrogenase family)
MLARGEEYLTSLAKEIESTGGHALVVPADVSQEKQIEEAFTAIRRELGAPEVLLYNAAMRPFGRLMETKPSTFENTWRVCVLGAFLCAQRVVPDMLTARKGVILRNNRFLTLLTFAVSASATANISGRMEHSGVGNSSCA